MGNFIWRLNSGVDVSSYGQIPFKVFSPFSFDEAYGIPVPGDERKKACSVEGIWQGLKIINGETEERLFERRPKKRKGMPEGHKFGEEILDYDSARRQIYVPAYGFHAVHNALPEALGALEQLLESGDVFLHDVEKNGDINDLSSPLAHSSVLVDILNVLKDAPIPPFNKKCFLNLQEQTNALLDYRDELTDSQIDLLDDLITFAYLFSSDTLHQTYALRFIREADILTDRLERYLPSIETMEPYEACLRR